METDARQDTGRVRVAVPCRVRHRGQTHGFFLEEVSRSGCRVLAPGRPLHNGVTVDISARLGNKPFLVTGVVINSNEEGFGVSILAISEANSALLEDMLAGASPKASDASPQFRDPTNILVLGAGGGKLLAQLKMIDFLEQELGASILDSFDAFAGVSSGALILLSAAAGYETSRIRALLDGSLKRVGWPAFLPFHNLMNKDSMHSMIDSEFASLRFRDLRKPAFACSRNYESSIYKYYSSWEEGDFALAEVIKRAIAIPVLMGTHEGEMDAAVGLFVNPAELLLRFLRHRELLNGPVNLVYIDSGFDPLRQAKPGTFRHQNVLSQLLWSVAVMQRDLNLLANDRIVSEFPRVHYHSYFFTYSRVYDLARNEDFFLAEKEVAANDGPFRAWARGVREAISSS